MEFEPMSIVNEIVGLFHKRGDAAYHGEAVSQTEHALQSAALAERQGAPDNLIVAALLHDIGHLLDGQDEDLAQNGVDGQHEAAAHAWLSRYFGPEVTEPVRLHVAAKRYLCAKNEAYLKGLSPASKLSLELQGGPMTPLERARFETNPHYRDALRLRYWDDTAKVPNLEVPGLDHYRARLEAAINQATANTPETGVASA
jgi:phosphonate degradation associated HDIG domain protein